MTSRPRLRLAMAVMVLLFTPLAAADEIPAQAEVDQEAGLFALCERAAAIARFRCSPS